MANILITGGSGLVGGHIVEMLRGERNVHTTYLSHMIGYPDVTSHRLDLASESDITHLIETIQPDAVIHSAAMSNIDHCEKLPKEAFHINATATEVLAELSVQYGFRLIYISTDMVFDGKRGNYGEDDTANPVNVYGNSKLMGERFIQAVCENYVIARTALVYGRSLQYSGSFSQSVTERLGRGEQVKLFTDQFRTPILVQDLAAALIELCDLDFQGIIHLGGDTSVDRYTFGKRLAELKGYDSSLLLPVKMDSVQVTAARPVDVSLDTGRASQVLTTRLRGYYEGLQEA